MLLEVEVLFDPTVGMAVPVVVMEDELLLGTGKGAVGDGAVEFCAKATLTRARRARGSKRIFAVWWW